MSYHFYDMGFKDGCKKSLQESEDPHGMKALRPSDFRSSWEEITKIHHPDMVNVWQISDVVNLVNDQYSQIPQYILDFFNGDTDFQGAEQDENGRWVFDNGVSVLYENGKIKNIYYPDHDTYVYYADGSPIFIFSHNYRMMIDPSPYGDGWLVFPYGENAGWSGAYYFHPYYETWHYHPSSNPPNPWDMNQEEMFENGWSRPLLWS